MRNHPFDLVNVVFYDNKMKTPANWEEPAWTAEVCELMHQVTGVRATAVLCDIADSVTKSVGGDSKLNELELCPVGFYIDGLLKTGVLPEAIGCV